MSHLRAISLRFAILQAMSRLAVIVLCMFAVALIGTGCSKAAGNQDKKPPVPATTTADPGAAPSAMMAPEGGPSMGRPAGTDPAGEPAVPAGADDGLKLKPAEGKLSIEVPADAKAGSETVAKIIVTPGKGYHVNLEYPTKLTLTPADGVTLARTSFVAGGRDKSKGDADRFDEDQLAIAVKLTPAAAGSYTINGSFKFAVCDPAACLAKKENIAITVAAK